MRKQLRYSGISFAIRKGALVLCAIFLSLVLASSNMVRVRTVSFFSADSLEITADEYIVAPNNPYILLFHEQGSSRGEYHTIARRLCNLDYNCLAVDLRNGGNSSRVSNETARRCRSSRCPTGINELQGDAEAALKYIQSKTELPVVLFGSGANASLSLKIAMENEHVRATVALSPGEYFLPTVKIQDLIAGIKKPVFVSSSKAEIPCVSELSSGVEDEYLTLFEPKRGDGHRGTASLTEEYEENNEYWIALILFFIDLI